MNIYIYIDNIYVKDMKNYIKIYIYKQILNIKYLFYLYNINNGLYNNTVLLTIINILGIADYVKY